MTLDTRIATCWWTATSGRFASGREASEEVLQDQGTFLRKLSAKTPLMRELLEHYFADNEASSQLIRLGQCSIT